MREKVLSLVQKRGLLAETYTTLMEDDDWRSPIIKFLSNPSGPSNKRTRTFATRFILLDGELFKKGIGDDTLLRCLGKVEAMRVMSEVHEGICGAHQAGIKMK